MLVSAPLEPVQPRFVVHFRLDRVDRHATSGVVRVQQQPELLGIRDLGAIYLVLLQVLHQPA